MLLMNVVIDILRHIYDILPPISCMTCTVPGVPYASHVHYIKLHFSIHCTSCLKYNAPHAIFVNNKLKS